MEFGCFCLKNLKWRRRAPRVCVCLCVCLSVCVSVPRKWFLGNYWSRHHQTWHSDCLRQANASYVIILTLTFIQVHTYLDHENDKCSIISKNRSSNAHQVRCEDSQNRGLYSFFSLQRCWALCKVTTASQTWPMCYLYYNNNISENI